MHPMLDAENNNATNRDQVSIIRVTARNGERFRLRDPGDIRRFLAAVGRFLDEEVL